LVLVLFQSFFFEGRGGGGGGKEGKMIEVEEWEEGTKGR
jgi:hypothetical protein